MKQVDDFCLLTKIRSGEVTAFKDLYKQFSKPLYIYAYRRTADHEVAEDILQEVFISVWEKRADLEIEISLKSYLFQAVRFKIADQYRRNGRMQKFFNEQDVRDWEDPRLADRIDSRLRLGAVMHNIDELPEKMRLVFKMSRFEHRSVNSIAALLNLSPQTVKNQLSKALSTLRRKQALWYINTLIYAFSTTQ